MGASLLVFKNKSDVAGCMDEAEMRKVGRSLGSSRADEMTRWTDSIVCRHYSLTQSRHTDGRS